MEKNKKNMNMKYVVEYGSEEQAVELMETHKAIISTNSPEIKKGDIVELQSTGRLCGAIILEVHSGDGKIILEDPLRSYLGVKKGDYIAVRKIEPVNAFTATIEIEGTVIDEAQERIVGVIKSQLAGEPLHEGERVIVLLGSKPFTIHIKETEPSGIVVVEENTNIMLDREEKRRKEKISITPTRDSPGEILLEKPDVSFDNVGGLEKTKKTLKRIAYVIKNPESTKKLGISPANVFLYGPPGTGKTLLARAMAQECGMNFISLGCADIESKWVGVAVSRIKAAFDEAVNHGPCIIFFDEFDAIAHVRGDAHDPTRDITNQLLIELNEPRKGVFVIVATNRIDLIDEAILRRFHYKVEVGLPDRDARREIVRIHLKNRDVEEKEAIAKWLVEVTEGLSGSDINDIIEKAAYEALDEVVEGREPKIRLYHFEKVLTEHAKMRPKESYIR